MDKKLQFQSGLSTTKDSLVSGSEGGEPVGAVTQSQTMANNRVHLVKKEFIIRNRNSAKKPKPESA